MKHICRNELEAMKDETNAAFVARLNPAISPDAILGVKVPHLRALAKQMIQEGNTAVFFRDVPHRYLEENILHAILISQIKDFDRCLKELEAFQPYLNSWSVTDVITPAVFNKHADELEPVLYEWLKSDQPYTVRVAVVLFMNVSLKHGFKKKQARTIAALRFDNYYVKMAVAWYMATALITQRDTVLSLLEQHKMDPWTHNKTIQKAIESYRIKDEDKVYLKTLRRRK